MSILPFAFISRAFAASYVCGGGRRIQDPVINPEPSIYVDQLQLNSMYKAADIKENSDSSEDETVSWNWKTATPFVPPVTGGKVIKVYDGDTITIATKLPFDPVLNAELSNTVYRFAVRLNGIDCPEIKGKTAAEKERAVLAREALKQKILDKHVELKNVSTEKYGRLLADVYITDADNNKIWLNQWLLDNGHAVKYDGGTKERPEEWN